jgi:polysaccharide biosynthesis transport protein
MIRRNKGTLAFITSLGLLASLLLTFLQKPTYQARASLEIQNFNENFLNMSDISPTADERDSSTLQPDLQTQVKILQSESVLYRVITKLNLDEKLSPEKDRARLSAGRNALGLPHSRRELSREDVLRLVTKNLTVKTEPNTRLVEIFYDSPDPRLADNAANG